MVVLPASMWAMIPMLRTLARAAAVSVATGASLSFSLVSEVWVALLRVTEQLGYQR